MHDRTKLEAARPCLSKADLLTPGCGEGKCSVIHGHQARSPGGECSKGLNSSKAFRERFFFLRERFIKRVREGSCGVCGQFVDIFLILDDFL